MEPTWGYPGYSGEQHQSDTGRAPDERTCPRCAETIKARATACRFCGASFVPEPTKKTGIWVAALVAGIVVAVVTAGLFYIVASSDSEDEDRTSPEANTQSLRGTVQTPLTAQAASDQGLDPSNFSQGDEPCTSQGGYDDVHEGAPVAVKDGEGTLLATGRVGPGTVLLDSEVFACVFQFSVSGIPESDFYTVGVGSRDGLPYSKDELDQEGWNLALTLGG